MQFDTNQFKRSLFRIGIICFLFVLQFHSSFPNATLELNLIMLGFATLVDIFVSVIITLFTSWFRDKEVKKEGVEA